MRVDAGDEALGVLLGVLGPGELLGVDGDVEDDLGPKALAYLDGALHEVGGTGPQRRVLHMLGADADGDRPPFVVGEGGMIAEQRRRHAQLLRTEADERRAAGIATVERTRHEVHRGRPDEARHEQVVRRVVQHLG